MDSIRILPSEIRFSQSNISNRFSSALGNEYIGIVLDNIYDGDKTLKQRIRDNLKVGRQRGYEDLWFTVNNRSLWVLKELQLLGKIKRPIKVNIDPTGIANERFSTENGGTCVVVRQRPVGGVRAKPDPFWEYRRALQSFAIDDDGYDSDEYYQ